MTARDQTATGERLPGRAHAPVRWRNSIPVFDEPACATLERSNALQTIIDLCAAVYLFLFLSVVAFSIDAAVFILFFVDTR